MAPRLSDLLEELSMRDSCPVCDAPPRSPPSPRYSSYASYEYSSTHYGASGSSYRSSYKTTYSPSPPEAPRFSTHRSRIPREDYDEPPKRFETRRSSRDPHFGSSRDERSGSSRHTRDRSYSHREPSRGTESSRYDRDDSRAGRSRYEEGSRTRTNTCHGESHRSSHYDDHDSHARGSTRRESDSHRPSTSHHGDRDSYSRSGPTRDSSSRHHSSSHRSSTHYSSTRRDDGKTRGGQRTNLSSIPEPAFVDHYKVLGVSPRASTDEIKRVAKKMRVDYHPDKLKKPGMSEKELQKIDERAAKIGQAADVLSDKDLRMDYDDERYEMGL